MTNKESAHISKNLSSLNTKSIVAMPLPHLFIDTFLFQTFPMVWWAKCWCHNVWKGTKHALNNHTRSYSTQHANIEGVSVWFTYKLNKAEWELWLYGSFSYGTLLSTCSRQHRRFSVLWSSTVCWLIKFCTLLCILKGLLL